MSGAYYNEFDPFAAEWLRNLIKAGEIAPGDVDSRNLWDVTPDDLKGYTQVHLCAGIGIWSRALREEGIPDDLPLWSASFPCQPFSTAGKKLGFADERHLWPAGLHLIRERLPDRIIGEQTSSLRGLAWMELVQADLEAATYAVGRVDTCAAGFGKTPGRAYHWRHRIYWCGDRRVDLPAGVRLTRRRHEPEHGVAVPADPSDARGVGHTDSERRLRWEDYQDEGRWLGVPGQAGSGVDLVACVDGAWRPVERGSFPLGHEDTARVGRLRAYGNALDLEQAKGFVKAWKEAVL